MIFPGNKNLKILKFYLKCLKKITGKCFLTKKTLKDKFNISYAESVKPKKLMKLKT